MSKSNTAKAVQLSKSQQAKIDSFQFTSTKVRYLAAQNMSTGDISRALGIRYQHARNVLNQTVKTPREQI